MPEVFKFSSFEELKSFELQESSVPPNEEKLNECLSKFVAISLLNPRNYETHTSSSHTDISDIV